MAEAVRILAGEDGLVGPDQLLADERAELCRHERASRRAREPLHRPSIEDLALDCTVLEHCPLLVVQLIQACSEQGVNGRRNRDGRQVSDDRPAPVLGHEDAVVDQHRDHLLDEQRVTFGRFGDARFEQAGNLVPAHEIRDQLHALAVRERLEQHCRGVQLASGPAGTNLEQL